MEKRLTRRKEYKSYLHLNSTDIKLKLENKSSYSFKISHGPRD